MSNPFVDKAKANMGAVERLLKGLPGQHVVLEHPGPAFQVRAPGEPARACARGPSGTAPVFRWHSGKAARPPGHYHATTDHKKVPAAAG